MEPLLFLVHRIPFPPNKGDKVRSFNLLRFLASRYRIHLGTFVDAAADRAHIAVVNEYCSSTKVRTIRPAFARLRSLAALSTGEPLTLRYYRDAALAQWVRDVVREHAIRKAIVFSSSMAQYVTGIQGVRFVIDFVDVDSAKWLQYGSSRAWPLSALFQREGRRLLAYERAISIAADASVFVTRAEADLFTTLAPECAGRVHCAPNGVDIDFFTPSDAMPTPYPRGDGVIVFTGAMDYWPNVDAACWFAREVLPAIIARRPHVRFYIVGMQPVASVRALARLPGVVVTGRVADVRPYLQHARVVVAPLRVARGIQNKVLEAMAMARPVVVSAPAAVALCGSAGVDFEVAGDAADFARKTLALMEPQRGDALGLAARTRILRDYDWATNLEPFDKLLGAPSSAAATLAQPTLATHRQ